MNIKKNILLRLYLCFGFICLFGLMVILQGFRIQTADNGYWATMADSLTTDLMMISPERGNIYSADDRLLATSLPYFELRMDLASEAMTDAIFNENVDALSRKMAENFGQKSASEYKRELILARKKRSRYHLIKRRVNYNELKEIQNWPLFELGQYKGGLIVITRQERKKPYELLASRTIGYVRENAQDVGLEAQYDTQLSGKEGRRLMQKIAGGNWVPLTDENAIEPKNGADLITTIDVNLQDVAEYALMKSMYEHNAEHGCVVVMEVKTGAIRAIANLGQAQGGGYAELYNYAVGKSTEPGSTFKLASMLAMIEDGLLSPEDSVDIHNGRTVFYGREMFDAGNWNPYRFIKADKVFAISSNVGTATFAQRAYNNQEEKFYRRLEQYHLTEPTGVEISGEADPVIRTPDKWSKLSVPWISIGYETQFTPLQILNFYNAVANGGRMMRPYLVEKIVDHGKVVEHRKPHVIDRQISTEEAITEVRKMLERVVEDGTARNIRSEHYKIAGKTGTAKLLDPQKGYVDRYQASFAGFFPADNPRYSCIVVIVGPSAGLTHGGQVAAPVFKEIADKIMSTDISLYTAINSESSMDSLQPGDPVEFVANREDAREICGKLGISLRIDEEVESEIVRGRIDGKQGEALPLEAADGAIPDVRGMNVDDAVYYLENLGCKVVFHGKGKVRRQSLNPGTPVKGGEIISLELDGNT